MLGGALHDSQVFCFVIHRLAENFGLYNWPQGTYIQDRRINFVD